jgi:tetratricopeptide (TPR) repeat protein
VVSDGAAGEKISDYNDAMNWFGAEHLAILALVWLAAEIGMAGHAWRLAWAATTFLRRTGRRSERVAIHRTALAAARQAADRLGEATISRNLATANARLGDFAHAASLLDRAARLFRELDDEGGAFKNHLAYTRVLSAQGKHAEAFGHAKAAWDLVRETGDEVGQADALTAMAEELALLHHNDAARPLGARALDLYTAIGHAEGEADVLLTLGDIERALGWSTRAADCYQRSYALDSALGDRYWAAVSLERLAETYPDGDDRVRALRGALAIYQEIQHPDAARVKAQLE